jgi:hypothetical protein
MESFKKGSEMKLEKRYIYIYIELRKGWFVGWYAERMGIVRHRAIHVFSPTCVCVLLDSPADFRSAERSQIFEDWQLVSCVSCLTLQLIPGALKGFKYLKFENWKDDVPCSKMSKLTLLLLTLVTVRRRSCGFKISKGQKLKKVKEVQTGVSNVHDDISVRFKSNRHMLHSDRIQQTNNLSCYRSVNAYRSLNLSIPI